MDRRNDWLCLLFCRRPGWLAGLLLAGWCLLATLSSARAQTAGQVDPTFGASLGLADNVLFVTVQPDGKILVSGLFPKGIARLQTDGSVDPSFDTDLGPDRNDGAQSALQADGKIVIIGNFVTFNGVARRFIARLNADGSLDTGFDPGAGPNGLIIGVAVQPDGKIIVSGTFGTFNGVTRNGVARLNPDGSVDTTFNVSTPANTTCYASVVQPDGRVIVGGRFTLIGGVTRRGIARVNPDGSLDSTFDPGSNVLFSKNMILQPDGKVIVSTGNGITRIDADGSLDTGFSSSSASFNSMALQPDGKIVVGGSFTTFGGVARNGLVRLNADGSIDTGFDPGTGVNTPPYQVVSSVSLQTDGKVLAGGSFNSFDDTPENGIVRLSASGSLDLTFQADNVPGPNAVVYTTLTQADGRIVIGGGFSTFNGVACKLFARLNTDGTLDTTFVGTTMTNNRRLPSVEAMVQQPDGKIVAVGNFSPLDNGTANDIVRLNPDGSLDTSFQAGTGGDTTGDTRVVTLQPDGKILIAGYFTTFNGTARNYLARLNADGSVDMTFDPGAGPQGTSPYPSCMAVQADGKILFGGNFSTYAGTPRACIARLNADGSLDPTFDPGTGMDHLPEAFAVLPGGKIVVVGKFTTYNGTARNGILQLNPDGSLDTSFDPGSGVGPPAATGVDAPPYLNTLALQPDGKMVIGGFFTTFNGLANAYIARLGANGALDASFNSGVGANNEIKSLVLQSSGRLIASGDFSTYNGSARNFVVRINTDGSLDPGFNPGIGVPSVNALMLQPADGKVVIGGTFTTGSNQYANALARLRTDGTPDITFQPPFNIGDTVPALALQPADGNIVVSQVPAGSASGNASALAPARTPGTRLAAVAPRQMPIGGPHTQTKITNPIVRCLSASGSLDASFNAAAGTDGTAYCLGLQANGQIVVGGSFDSLNAAAGHLNVGRLNADGSLDASFAATANATVQVVLAQANGALVLGGLFTQVNGSARARLARLLASGALDTGFSAAAGTDGPVAGLWQQSDGRLVAGGSFAHAAGVARSCLARFNSDGTLDTGFNAGAIVQSGGTALVSSIVQQVDGKLIVAGLFGQINGVSLPNVARLNPDGSVDPTFNPGSGTDAIVNSIALQPDGKTLLGGSFTNVDGLERDAAARLLGDYDLDDYPALGQWRIINFGTPNATGNAADTAMPFGDGVANLLKYALNLNAQAPDTTPMTATGSAGLPLVGRDASGQHLTLTFVERQPGTAPGVTYVPQFANGPGAAAFAANAQATSVVTLLDATWERVTVTDSVSLLAQPARFARLLVTDP